MFKSIYYHLLGWLARLVDTLANKLYTAYYGQLEAKHMPNEEPDFHDCLTECLLYSRFCTGDIPYCTDFVPQTQEGAITLMSFLDSEFELDFEDDDDYEMNSSDCERHAEQAFTLRQEKELIAENYRLSKCSDCLGTGFAFEQNDTSDHFYDLADCKKCKGTGYQC